VQRILLDAPNIDYDAKDEDVTEVKLTSENANEVLNMINNLNR
jgi:hypothetical protein